MKKSWSWWKQYWVVELIQFLFPKAVKSIVQEALTEALHSEFGWVWREEEQGGKFIAQARAQGWRDCFDEVLSGRRRPEE